MKALILAIALLTAGCANVGSAVAPTSDPTPVVGWWCWGKTPPQEPGTGLLPGAHPSPYAKAPGVDHPCTPGEMEAVRAPSQQP
jgi:hypothetical protein